MADYGGSRCHFCDHWVSYDDEENHECPGKIKYWSEFVFRKNLRGKKVMNIGTLEIYKESDLKRAFVDWKLIDNLTYVEGLYLLRKNKKRKLI